MSFNPAGGNISGADDVALSNPQDNQVLTYNSGLGVWQNENTQSQVGSAPYIVTPANGTEDIGALINTAFQTYDAVVIAPGVWALTTTIQIGDGQSLSGLGWQTSVIRVGAGLGANPAIQMATGTASNFMLRDFEIDCNLIATYGFYGYATGAPAGADASPDHTPIFQNLSIYDATSHGMYLGGSYTGGLRESRVMNCKFKHNGGSGLYLASSDCFISNCTTHGNGGIGYEIVSGSAGNAKFVQCKAYYEDIGFEVGAVRCYLSGCEVQDCTTYGVWTNGQNFIECVIDTCGDATTPGLYVNGSGCSFAVHMVGRNPPNTNVINAAVQLSTGTQVHAGFINTNVTLGGFHYQTEYQNANRPAAPSSLSVI